MAPRSSQSRSRIVFGIVFLTLVALFALVLYWSAGLAKRAFRVDQTRGEVVVQTNELASIVLFSVLAGLAIVLFVGGAYLLLRIGRMVTQERVGGKPTELPDAWDAARVSDDEYARVDEQLDELRREWEGGDERNE